MLKFNARRIFAIATLWAALAGITSEDVNAQEYRSRSDTNRSAYPTRSFPTRNPYARAAAPEHSRPRNEPSYESHTPYDNRHAGYARPEYREPVEDVGYDPEVERAQYRSRPEYRNSYRAVRPVAHTQMHPVEIVDGPVYTSECESCGGSCGYSEGGICDYAPRCKDCDRMKCPCPSDEALSYYRCNFYGHYPTLWRTWPRDFMRYRPEREPETVYDRYRQPVPGEARAPGSSTKDEDLDKQLQNLLKDQKAPGSAPNNEPAPRSEPERLPPDNLEEPMPPTPAPEGNSDSWGRRRGYRDAEPEYAPGAWERER